MFFVRRIISLVQLIEYNNLNPALHYNLCISRTCVPVPKKSGKNFGWKCLDCRDSYDITLRGATYLENQYDDGVGKTANGMLDC